MDKAAKAETLTDFVASLPGGAQPPANKPAEIAASQRRLAGVRCRLGGSGGTPLLGHDLGQVGTGCRLQAQ